MSAPLLNQSANPGRHAAWVTRVAATQMWQTLLPLPHAELLAALTLLPGHHGTRVAVRNYGRDVRERLTGTAFAERVEMTGRLGVTMPGWRGSPGADELHRLWGHQLLHAALDEPTTHTLLADVPGHRALTETFTIWSRIDLLAAHREAYAALIRLAVTWTGTLSELLDTAAAVAAGTPALQGHTPLATGDA